MQENLGGSWIGGQKQQRGRVLTLDTKALYVEESFREAYPRKKGGKFVTVVGKQIARRTGSLPQSSGGKARGRL